MSQPSLKEMTAYMGAARKNQPRVTLKEAQAQAERMRTARKRAAAQRKWDKRAREIRKGADRGNGSPDSRHQRKHQRLTATKDGPRTQENSNHFESDVKQTPENITYTRIDTHGTVWTTVGRVDYWWASICSMHRNYNAQCKLCRAGRWVSDSKRTPESYRTNSTGDLPDMEIPTR